MSLVRWLVGLTGILWALLCWAAAPADVYESQDWEWAGLDKATAPIGTHVNWVVE